jgi:hypothetical protein
MTHDQSFLGPSCSSVNIRVDTSNYLLVHMDTVSDASYIMQSALDIITEKQKYSFANLIMTPPTDAVIYQHSQHRKA